MSPRYSIHADRGNRWRSFRWARWDAGGLTLSPIFHRKIDALSAAFVDSLRRRNT